MKPRLLLIVLLASIINADKAHAIAPPIDMGSETSPAPSGAEYGRGHENDKSFEPSKAIVDTNVFRQAEEGGRIAAEANPGNSFRSASQNYYDDDTNADFGRFGSPSDWCSGSDCITDSIEIQKNKPEEAAGRKSVMPVLSPLSGARDEMDGQTVTSLGIEAMSSDLAVQKMVVNLTEPGVADAVNRSIDEGNQRTQSRLLAQSAFIQAAQTNPDTAQFTINTYLGCIQNRLAEGRAWGAAQSRCMGGDRITKLSNDPDKYTINPISAMSPTDSFDHPDSGLGIEPDKLTPKSNRISAVDYLFNQLRFNDGGSKWYGVKVAKFKKDFRSMVGDVVFFFNNGNGGPGSGGLHNPAHGMYQIYVRTFPPFANSKDDGDLPDDLKPDSDVNSYPAEKVYRDLVEERYKDIHRLLAYRCQWYNDECTGDVCHSDKGEDFWTDHGGSHQQIIKLSMPGLRLKPQIFEAVFSMFWLEGYRKTSDGRAVRQCELLDAENDSGESSLKNIMSPLSGGSGSNLARSITDHSTARVRVAFLLAQRVAFGQYIGTLARAADLVKRLTGGSYDSVVRRYMLDMIYQAAGTEDLRGVLQRNVEETKKIINQISYYIADQKQRTSDQVLSGIGGNGQSNPGAGGL